MTISPANLDLTIEQTSALSKEVTVVDNQGKVKSFDDVFYTDADGIGGYRSKDSAKYGLVMWVRKSRNVPDYITNEFSSGEEAYAGCILDSVNDFELQAYLNEEATGVNNDAGPTTNPFNYDYFGRQRYITIPDGADGINFTRPDFVGTIRLTMQKYWTEDAIGSGPYLDSFDTTKTSFKIFIPTIVTMKLPVGNWYYDVSLVERKHSQMPWNANDVGLFTAETAEALGLNLDEHIGIKATKLLHGNFIVKNTVSSFVPDSWVGE
tara:strand:+ start:4852 stop:5646 length:795 start_codon:yes stop_codon:yes gene_type:complete